MAYSYITWGALRTQLAQRLDDSGNVFWVDAEIAVILTEALRTWGILSGFWRERGTFNTVSGTAFYDIPSSITSGLLNYTVTDRDVIKALQYNLLESASSQTAWGGTEMFTLADLTRAIERRRDQFLQETGCNLTHSTQAVPPPPIGRVSLTDDVIDVRRAVWQNSDGYYHLHREDEFSLTAYDRNWTVNPATPYGYSVMATQPVQIQLGPVPIVGGTLDLVTVEAGATLDPAVSATTLELLDDLTPFVKWGALADLLGKDGVARDPERAQFCEKRYQQGVQLTRLLACVLTAQINDVPVQPTTFYDMDAGNLNWQNKSDDPVDVALGGLNLAALRPVPDGIYSVTMDVVRKAPIPANDGAFVQLGREQLDAVLDYAEHLAMFKVGGAEFTATIRQADNFMLQAITYNQRLSAAARFVIAPKEYSQKEGQMRPRRVRANALGAATSLEAVNG